MATRDRALAAEVSVRLGRFPADTPLELEMGASYEGPGCTRTALRYSTEPGERVSAWLLRPEGQAPARGWPGVVACHQHAGNFEWGKSEPAGLTPDPMYHYGLELCQRGFVVVCPDHLCFEDRRTPQDLLQASPELLGERYELFELTKRVLEGSSLQTKYVHDLRRAVDVLDRLPEVDSSRLVTIGHSLGGQEALWLTFLDPRIRAAASSCGFAPIRDILAAGINHNKAMYVPGLLDVCDIEDIVSSLAPRAFLLLSGEEDRIFPIAGVRRLVEQAIVSYRAAGVPERFEAILFPSGHSFPDDLRPRAYAFLERQLEG